MSALDSIRLHVELKSISIEMRCKACGNGVAGTSHCLADELDDKREFFTEQAKSHVSLCSGCQSPEFEFVVTDCDVRVK